MVRTFLLFAFAVSLVFCITPYSCAELIDNGDGTITQIRSDGTKLMWTQDTLLAGDAGLPEGRKNWSEAKLWAGNLDFAGHNDWRLPRTPGATTNGVTTEGELGDLYHSELANLMNLYIFKMSNTHNNVFWTEKGLDATTVFIVNFGNFKGKYSYSYQQTCSAEDNQQAWAVRDVTDSAAGTETTEATTDTKVAEAAAEAGTKVDADTEDVAVTEDIAVTEDVAVTEVTTDTEAKASTETEVAANTETTEDAEITADDTKASEAAAEAEVAADVKAIEEVKAAVDTEVATVTESADITETTTDVEASAGAETVESTEPEGVQEHTRSKGETEGDKITLHVLNKNDIKVIYNGDCIKMFWEEEPGKDAKITLCLYGIDDYRWEEKNFWISFNKGSSIKCDEVSIDIPLDVMTHEQINAIFKIDNY